VGVEGIEPSASTV